MIELSLVLPVLNEEEIIEVVVEDVISVLQKKRIDFEIILVENESEDNSLKVIKKLARRDKRIKVLTTKRGYGEAILGGLKKAMGKYVGYMPSDGQINTKVLPHLFKILKENKADIVGTQRITRENMTRKILSKVFNVLLNTVFSLTSKDTNGDPKIFPKKLLPVLNLKSKDSFLSAELLIKAKILGLRLKEIPTVSLSRKGGKSTVTFKTNLEFLKNILRYKLRLLTSKV